LGTEFEQNAWLCAAPGGGQLRLRVRLRVRRLFGPVPVGFFIGSRSRGQNSCVIDARRSDGARIRHDGALA
jgi:hypothetical protein